VFIFTAAPLVNDATNTNIPTNKLDFSRIDHAGLAASLLATDWRQYFSLTDDIDIAWEAFSSYIMSLITKFTPIKSIRHTTNKGSALPFDIVNLIKKKKAAWKIYKKI
jgi:hypothetical protein